MVLINRVIYHYVKNLFPDLPLILKKANIRIEPELFVKRQLKKTMIYSGLLTVVLLMVIIKESLSILLLPLGFMILTILIYSASLSYPKYLVKKRKNEIETDLLYSSRHLLLALESGIPLINALIETSKIHTKSSKYFNEITSDIYMGWPLEKAINYSIKYSPSKSYKDILTDIKNSLTTGTDLTEGLKVTLKDMADDHLDKIAAYGKKLNPMTVFYMIFGTIVPALGMAIGTIAISFLPNFQLGVPQVIVIGFVIILIQLFFITLFKSYQPNIDL